MKAVHVRVHTRCGNSFVRHAFMDGLCPHTPFINNVVSDRVRVAGAPTLHPRTHSIDGQQSARRRAGLSELSSRSGPWYVAVCTSHRSLTHLEHVLQHPMTAGAYIRLGPPPTGSSVRVAFIDRYLLQLILHGTADLRSRRDLDCDGRRRGSRTSRDVQC